MKKILLFVFALILASVTVAANGVKMDGMTSPSVSPIHLFKNTKNVIADKLAVSASKDMIKLFKQEKIGSVPGLSIVVAGTISCSMIKTGTTSFNIKFREAGVIHDAVGWTSAS